MFFLKRLLSPNKLQEVFTPNTVAKLNYVSRPILEIDLEKYILMPGKQIIVYGHSGSGKTTLVRKTMTALKKNYIRTHCESNTTFNDILLQAFDELNGFYIGEKRYNQGYTINANLKSEFSLIKTGIDSVYTQTQEKTCLRIVPPQLTPQKLAQFLGEIDCIWIIEDFHKVKPSEKRRIADVLKVFIDSANDFQNVKIICIGAVGTARELIELDNNLNTRTVELLVPLLTETEICNIINDGCNLMHIEMPKKLQDCIVYYSNNLAALAHQMCYDICFHSNILKTRIKRKKLDPNRLRDAVESYVRANSDSLNKLYDLIASIHMGWYVLKAFDVSEKENLSFGEIKSSILHKHSISDEELFELLQKLGTSEYESIIRFDANSNKYSISSPFFTAFLKIKLALEKDETRKRQTKKKRKKANGYALTQRVYEDNFDFESYYALLNSLMVRNLRETYKIKKIG